MKKISIKTKVTIWYAIIVFAISIIALFIMTSASYDILIRDSSEKLVQSVENTIRMSGTPPRELGIKPRHEHMFFEKGVHTAVYDENFELVKGFMPYEFAGELQFKNNEIIEKNYDGEDFLIYSRKINSSDNQTMWVTGVISIANESSMMNGVLKTNLILIFIMLIIVSVGGYLIMKKALKPVDKISNTAKIISESKDLSQRINLPPACDEIHHLANTFDTMLDKFEHLVKKEKQFTSDASHELRTPISVILAQGEYLLDIADTDKEKELAQTIVDKANQASKLVSRLLLLARIDSSRQQVNKEKVDLGVLLDIALNQMIEMAEKKEIVLITNTEDNVIVNADESLLLSAVTNLISNAIKYGKKGGHIVISASNSGNHTEIIVKDNGIGISSENLDKIWNRFYRVDDVRNDEYSSSGLGLPMVKSIVELHGGEIFVRSILDEGTEFRIVL